MLRKNATVSRHLIGSVLAIPAAIVFLRGGALYSYSAQEARSDRSETAEFQKFEPWLNFLRTRNARDYAITDPNAIDESAYVEIGGIQQWISIRGEDRKNPVLLFLHGGPGDATNPWGYAAFRSWLKDFTVVQWDQRGSGRTFGRNPAVSTITPERMVEDGIELSEWLKKRLHTEKIVLVGHSWGSVLGFFIVKARPELFYAFVGTGQVAADFARSSAVAYAALVEAASRQGNSVALAELEQIGPPPFKDGKSFAVQHKWANRLEGADKFLASALGFALAAPGYSVQDINDWFEGQRVTNERLEPRFDELDHKLVGGELGIPVFVVQGAQDYTTPVSLARAYVDSLRAPRKGFATIEGAGHFAVFTRQDDFLKEFSARVLPLIRQHFPAPPR